MASTAAVLNIVVSANTAQATAALARTDRQLKTTAASGAAANKSLGRFGVTGKQVAAGGVAALAYGTYKAVKASIDFEDAFSNVRKTVEGSDAELDKIALGLRDMTREIPVSVGELANLAAQAGALGVPTKDLLRFTRTAALLGTTTDMSAEDAANGLARIGNVMGASGKDFDRMASSLVDLGNKGASTEGEITQMALRFVGVAKQVGLTTPEVLGFSAALANVGEEAEAGGSAISRSFIEMGNAVGEGGAKLDAFAKVSGVSAQAFAQEFDRKPAQAMARFVGGLSKIRKEGGNVFKTLDELGLGEIRVRRAMLALAGSPKKLAAALGISEKAWRDMTAAEDEAEKKFDTTKSKLQLFGNAVNDLGIQMGDELRPAVDKAATALADGFNFVNDLNLDWGGIFDDAMKTINPAAYGQDFVRKFVTGMGDVGGAVAAAVNKAKGAIAGGAKIALDVGGDAVGAAKSAISKVKSVVGQGASIVLNVAGNAVSQAQAIWNRVKGIVGKAVSFAISLPMAAVGLARTLWGKVKDTISRSISIPVSVGEGAIDAANSLKDTLVGIFSSPISQPVNPQGNGGGSWSGRARGGRNIGPEVALVGEQGRELMRNAQGAWSMLGAKGPHLASIPAGSDIFTASETRKLLAAGIPGFAKGKKGGGGNKKPKKKAVTPTGNMWEAALASAELTDDTADDIAALTNLISYWKGQEAWFSVPRKGGKGTKGTAMAWDKLTAARQAIKTYQDQLAELTGAPDANELARMTELAELNKQLASTNAQRFAVSQSQYATLQGGLPPFGGTFHDGGIVPGPVGAERLILAQGGESVSKNAGVTVIVHDGAVDASKIEVIAGEAAQRAMRRSARSGGRLLPSGGG